MSRIYDFARARRTYVAVAALAVAVLVGSGLPLNQTASMGTITTSGGTTTTNVLPVDVNANPAIYELEGVIRSTAPTVYDDITIRLMRKGSSGTPPTVNNFRVRRRDNPQTGGNEEGDWQTSSATAVQTSGSTPETIGYEANIDLDDGLNDSGGHDVEIDISNKGNATEWEFKIQPSRKHSSYHGDCMEACYFKVGQGTLSRSSDTLGHDIVIADIINADDTDDIVAMSGTLTIGSPATQINSIKLWDLDNNTELSGASTTITSGRNFTISSFGTQKPQDTYAILFFLDDTPSSVTVDLTVTFD